MVGCGSSIFSGLTPNDDCLLVQMAALLARNHLAECTLVLSLLLCDSCLSLKIACFASANLIPNRSILIQRLTCGAQETTISDRLPDHLHIALDVFQPECSNFFL